MPYFLKLVIVCAILAFIVLRKSRLHKSYMPNNYPDHVNNAIQLINDNIEACKSGKDLAAAMNLINHFREDYAYVSGIEKAVKDMENKVHERKDRITVNKLIARNRNTKIVLN